MIPNFTATPLYTATGSAKWSYTATSDCVACISFIGAASQPNVTINGTACFYSASGAVAVQTIPLKSGDTIASASSGPSTSLGLISVFPVL